MLPRPHQSVMNMLPPGAAQSYGWSPYQPPGPGRLGSLRDRVQRHGWVALLILAAGLLAGYNRTGRGLLAMALTWAVVVMLRRHRGERIRMLAEYATVGALVFAVMTAAAPAPHPKAKAKPTARRKPPATKQVQDPWADLRTRAEKWWQTLGDNAPTIEFRAPLERNR